MRKSLTLVAMSGVRIVNKELRELGMTLPGFMERGKVIASLPSLGLLTLGGLTPGDWDVRYIDVDEVDDDAIARIAETSDELVAISSLSARIFDAYRLADGLRKLGKKVVIGGLHASVLPEEVALHSDSVVVGEGEEVWRGLLADFFSGNLKPLYLANRAREFEPWAVPRYDLLDLDKYNRITLQTTRGCPLDCSFCGASRLISHYKRKSIERVHSELKAITSRWSKPFVELADDNTFVHRRWSRELVEAIAVHQIRWFTESDIRLADDDELLKMLAMSGCAQVLIGLETSDWDGLRETDSKGWKQGRLAKYKDSIQKIQAHGITVNGCFILGFDSHTPATFEQTARFIEGLGLAEVQLTVLTPFPGTALHRRLSFEGRLLEKVYWSKCTLFDVVFRPKNMTVFELEKGLRDLATEVYGPENSMRRRAVSSAIHRMAAEDC